MNMHVSRPSRLHPKLLGGKQAATTCTSRWWGEVKLASTFVCRHFRRDADKPLQKTPFQTTTRNSTCIERETSEHHGVSFFQFDQDPTTRLERKNRIAYFSSSSSMQHDYIHNGATIFKEVYFCQPPFLGKVYPTIKCLLITPSGVRIPLKRLARIISPVHKAMARRACTEMG